VAEEVGLGQVPIIATACHDSAAAASIVPTQEEQATFVSSGTWSVLGTELYEPLLTPEAMACHFFNEVGACERIIFVQNSMGLWPLQECRREWLHQGHDWSYADLTQMAVQARPFAAIINPDDPGFFRPGDMAARIAGYCQRTGQEVPAMPGSLVRSLLEGLALRYRQGIKDLECMTGRPTKTIHILGGGSRNALLCQFTADATGRPVLAGPSEATATTTVLLQALARGRLSSLAEAREVAARSSALLRYDPQPSTAWDEAYAMFLRLAGS
jgi:rhamnulokinase